MISALMGIPVPYNDRPAFPVYLALQSQLSRQV